jgi:hypothetical protein
MKPILLALLLTGCSDMVLTHPRETTTITWVDRKCGHSAGCALVMADRCYIAAPKEEPQIVAHELLHCMGAEHAR